MFWHGTNIIEAVEYKDTTLGSFVRPLKDRKGSLADMRLTKLYPFASTSQSQKLSQSGKITWGSIYNMFIPEVQDVKYQSSVSTMHRSPAGIREKLGWRSVMGQITGLSCSQLYASKYPTTPDRWATLQTVAWSLRYLASGSWRPVVVLKVTIRDDGRWSTMVIWWDADSICVFLVLDKWH